MKESTESCVVWDQVDDDTFLRFYQYLYTGDYKAAKTIAFPYVKRDDTAFRNALAKATRRVCTVSGFDFDNLKLWWIEARAVENFKAQYYPAHVVNPVIIRDNWDTNESFAPVFLSHAKLYVMADCYGIKPLMGLTLHKLHQVLCGFTVHPERLIDIIELVEYSFDHGPQGLQDFAASFACGHLMSLWTTRAFQDLVKKHPEISTSLMDTLLNNVYTPRDRARIGREYY